MVDLLSQVEAQKLEVVRKEEELTLVSQRSRRDQEALLEAQAKLERLEAEMAKVQEQLRRELENRQSLEEENERLEGRLNQLGEQREGTGPVEADSRSVSGTEFTLRRLLVTLRFIVSDHVIRSTEALLFLS